MSLIRAIINILTIVFKTAIFLIKVIFRFRLIVLLLLTVGSILINISLFTGTFYFENFNSIFQTITRTTPVAYQDREEIRITREELAASQEALNDQNAASIDLKKKIDQLIKRIDKDAETISEQNSENELLKGLVQQNEKLNETLREKNAELSDSRLSNCSARAPRSCRRSLTPTVRRCTLSTSRSTASSTRPLARHALTFMRRHVSRK